MLVLIHVSSMKTNRLGSRPPCQERQRWRLRATSERACSRANSVFFEPKPFAPKEHPYGVVRDLYPYRRQFFLQPVKRQMRRLLQPFHDEGAVWLQHALAMSAHLTGRYR